MYLIISLPHFSHFLSAYDSSPLFYILRQEGFAVTCKEDVKVSPEVNFCDGDNVKGCGYERIVVHMFNILHTYIHRAHAPVVYVALIELIDNSFCA